MPRFKPCELSPAEFQRRAREDGPLVIEGLALDSDACKQWTVQWFLENYGDTELLITNPDQSIVKGPMRGPLEDILADRVTKQYIQNTADIFNQCPELEASCRSRRSRRSSAPWANTAAASCSSAARTPAPPITAPTTSTASSWSQGEKEWRFVDARYSAWMYPFMPPSGLFAFSPVPPFEPAQKFPLYKPIPKLRTRLKPGDVLVNPPWWWHAVKNETPTTIAVATRWVIGLGSLEQPLLRLPELPVERRAHAERRARKRRAAERRAESREVPPGQAREELTRCSARARDSPTRSAMRARVLFGDERAGGVRDASEISMKCAGSSSSRFSAASQGSTSCGGGGSS